MRGLPDVREIVPDASRLFAGLKRVQYEWPQNGKTMTWSEVALEMRKQARALAVVNTKADAMALLDALDDPDARHLSTLLCGAHRLDTLELIKDRLRRGETCRVVSTQVVEAGVDVDFPMVLRALGPLDRIVQAAGRCNREGRMSELGRVLVFAPRDGARLPQGEYRSGTDTSVALMQSPDFSFDDPSVYEKYFRWLYQVVDRDAERIQALRERLDFPEVNVRFRMIEDDTVPVVVKYEGLDGRDESCREKVERLKAQLRRCGPGEARALLRKLQHYMVNVRSALLPDYQRDGLVAGLRPGVYEWLGKYDPIRGLVPRNREPQELVI